MWQVFVPFSYFWLHVCSIFTALYLLNSSTLLRIDGFVFSCQNNGLHRSCSISLIGQSIWSRRACYHCLCISYVSYKNLGTSSKTLTCIRAYTPTGAKISLTTVSTFKTWPLDQLIFYKLIIINTAEHQESCARHPLDKITWHIT